MQRLKRRTLLAATLLGLLAAAKFWSLGGPRIKGGPGRDDVARPEPPRAPPPERAWPLESLSSLEFDQTLTLLASEAKAHAARAADAGVGSWARVEGVAARIAGLHRSNLEKLAAAATHYRTLPPQALSRFEDFRREYERRYGALQGLIEKIEAGDAGAAREIEALVRESGALRPPRAVPPGESLPSRRLHTEHREPRSSEEEWRPREPVGFAPPGEKAGRLDSLFAARAAHAQEPADDDLGETPEVRLSPEVRALADELDQSPVKILNWVRDHVELVPVWGALQSSTTTLEARRGTAIDIASLTIALLRACGVRARYQAGTVRIPIERALNWLGNFESPAAAASLLASGGTPAAVQVDAAGRPVALRFEHVWVRAFIDYNPSRGACHVEGDTWLDLDAAIKVCRYEPVDILRYLDPDRPGAELDPQAFKARLDAILASAAAADPVTREVRGLDYAALDALLSPERPEGTEQLIADHPSLTMAQVLGLGSIVPSREPVLSAAPPFEVLARGWESARARDADRFKVHLRLEARGQALLAFEAAAAAAGASRFSIAFGPEAEIDARIVGDQLALEATDLAFTTVLVAGAMVVPELRRDGQPILDGTPVPMGTPLEVVVDFDEPALSTPPIRSSIVAGELTAIALDLAGVPGGISARLLEDFEGYRAALEAGTPPEDGAGLLEVILAATIHSWFQNVDAMNAVSGSALGCVTHRYPSAGIASSKLLAGSLFGLPLALHQQGITVDIPGDVTIVLSREGDPRSAAFTGLVQGFLGSTLESHAPLTLFNTADEPAFWLATSDALSMAGRAGDAIALIGDENAALVLPRLALPPADREEIGEIAERGLMVLAHEHPLLGGNGAMAGFAAIDPRTGGGIYRVTSGANGADPVDCLGRFRANCTGRACCSQPGGCSSSLDLLSRLWGSSFRDQLVGELMNQLSLESPGNAAKQFFNAVKNVLSGQVTLSGALASTLASFGPQAQPLVGLVVLFAALEAMQKVLCKLAPPPVNALCSVASGTEAVLTGIGAAGVAWRAVKRILLYHIRLELAVSGIEIPDYCYEHHFEG